MQPQIRRYLLVGDPFFLDFSFALDRPCPLGNSLISAAGHSST